MPAPAQPVLASGAVVDTAPFEIRDATIADLRRCYEIWFRTAVEGSTRVPSPRRIPMPLHVHELGTGDLIVALEGSEVVGFGAGVERSGVWFLIDLFVHPARQGRGIGHALLDTLVQRAPRRRATLASPDPRAVALYARAGLTPRWPVYHLLARPSSRFSVARGTRVDVADLDDLAALDRRVCGRDRSVDYDFWIGRVGATPLIVGHAGRRVGYAFVRPDDDGLWNRDAVVVGPVGVLDARDAIEAVLAVLEWVAAQDAPAVRALVPGPSPVLARLLESGFRVRDADTFMATADGIIDPVRMLPGPDLL